VTVPWRFDYHVTCSKNSNQSQEIFEHTETAKSISDNSILRRQLAGQNVNLHANALSPSDGLDHRRKPKVPLVVVTRKRSDFLSLADEEK
jgi:hypothetical protein